MTSTVNAPLSTRRSNTRRRSTYRTIASLWSCHLPTSSICHSSAAISSTRHSWHVQMFGLRRG